MANSNRTYSVEGIIETTPIHNVVLARSPKEAVMGAAKAVGFNCKMRVEEIDAFKYEGARYVKVKLLAGAHESVKYFKATIAEKRYYV